MIASAQTGHVIRPILAVLPLRNLSEESGQDYFSDSLTEELIRQLGRLNPEGLGVIARASAMRYMHSIKAIDQIARELRANYVIEGSVRRENSRRLDPLPQSWEDRPFWSPDNRISR